MSKSKWTRRDVLKMAGMGGVAALAKPARLWAAEQSRKPNIIFILTDDVGLGNISCCGGDKFKTPQIDALAQSGIRFEYCYSTPLCGPTRAEFLTGRYPFRTGMTTNGSGKVLKPANEIMIPTVLRPAGYVTAQVGKWGQLPLQPGDWGFNEYLRFLGNGKYWREQVSSYTLNGQEKDLPEGKYLPDVMHEFLVDFITRHRDQPFFVYYSMSHIHGKIMRTPDSAPDSTDLYADNIAYMDKLVGKLVAELDRLGLRERTLILFTGDNGTAGSSEKATVNGRPLSGHKNTMLEGGSRVPLVVNWKGTTPEGKVVSDLTDFSDFFPTFVELTDAKMPEGVTIDGRSFAPQIKGQPGNPREWIYVELAGRCYVRTARWKLNNSGEMFDMKKAPFEEKLVPADTPDAEAIAARKHLQALLEQINPVGAKTKPPELDQTAPRKKKREQKKQKAGKVGKAARR